MELLDQMHKPVCHRIIPQTGETGPVPRTVLPVAKSRKPHLPGAHSNIDSNGCKLACESVLMRIHPSCRSRHLPRLVVKLIGSPFLSIVRHFQHNLTMSDVTDLITMQLSSERGPDTSHTAEQSI